MQPSLFTVAAVAPSLGVERCPPALPHRPGKACCTSLAVILQCLRVWLPPHQKQCHCSTPAFFERSWQSSLGFKLWLPRLAELVAKLAPGSPAPDLGLGFAMADFAGFSESTLENQVAATLRSGRKSGMALTFSSCQLSSRLSKNLL